MNIRELRNRLTEQKEMRKRARQTLAEDSIYNVMIRDNKVYIICGHRAIAVCDNSDTIADVLNKIAEIKQADSNFSNGRNLE